MEWWNIGIMECCVMDPGGARFERDDFRLLAGSLVLPIPRLRLRRRDALARQVTLARQAEFRCVGRSSPKRVSNCVIIFFWGTTAFYYYVSISSWENCGIGTY